MIKIKKYVFPFLFGGVLISLIEYLSNNVDPDYAGIVSAFPIAIISTIFIEKQKLPSYFSSYTRSLFILLFLTFAYSLLLKKTDLSKNIILGFVLFVWLIVNTSYVLFFKK